MQLILGLLIIFEIVCVPAVFLHASLWAVVGLWLAFCAVAAGLFIWKKRRAGTEKQDDREKQVAAEKQEPWGGIFRDKKWKAPNPIQIICFLLIAYQLFLGCFFRHTDDDDAWYLGTAVSAYETGQLYAFSPYTGEPMELSAAGDYVLSPLPVLWAGIGRLTHIQPTVLAHTVMPFFLILWAYVVYALLGKRLFPKGRGADYFLLFMNVLNLFGYYSVRTTGTFLMFRSWQGKAIFCGIMVPLLFYYFLGLLQEKAYMMQSSDIEEKEKAGEQKKSGWKAFFTPSMRGLYLTMGASLLISFSAVTLMPLLLGAMAVTLAIAKKQWKRPLCMLLSCLPNVVLVAVYVLVL